MSNSAFRTHDGRTLQQAASDLVQREVMCCMSSMVATLAKGYGTINESEPRWAGRGKDGASDLADLSEQAFELAAPLLDYEEAAREAGWGQLEEESTRGVCEWTRATDEGADEPPYCLTAQEACEFDHIEPHEREVYEHWAVSTWFAEKLTAAGERVDTDFAGLCVWARTTTGQAISIDHVIEQITREMHAAR